MITLTATPVPVTPELTWNSHHTWGPTSTHLDGHLNDGRQIDIATYNERDFLDHGGRVDAMHLWLHGEVLAMRAGNDGVPTLIIPVNELTPITISEAIRRWLPTKRIQITTP